MEGSSKQNQVCIVGAGVFGLTTAIELQSRGYEVVIFERDTFPSTLSRFHLSQYLILLSTTRVQFL